MKTYLVSLCFTTYLNYEVEADSEDDAILEARRMWNEGEEPLLSSFQEELSPWHDGDVAEVIDDLGGG